MRPRSALVKSISENCTPDDLPLRAQAERMKRGETCHFLVRRNPNYPRRRQLLTSLNEYSANDANCSADSDQLQLLDMSTDSILEVADDKATKTISSSTTTTPSTAATQRPTTNVSAAKDIDAYSISSTSSKSSFSSSSSFASSSSSSSSASSSSSSSSSSLPQIDCKKCRNSFKSCKFCHKNTVVLEICRISDIP